MTVPARRTACAKRRRYGFDLRSTALFFVFLAVVVCAVGSAARVAADAVERRPAWVFVLVVIGVAGCLGLRRRWRVAGVARRAAAALDEAAREAAEQLEAPAVPPQRTAVEVTVDYRALTPEEFEAAIAALCARDGCSARRVVGRVRPEGEQTL
ncbi:restriction endonuclease, partial [Streptomyces sp. NPDC006265]